MSTILNFEKFQQIKKASINNRALLEQLIKEVEETKILKLLGVDVYKKIKEDTELSPIPADLQEILDEGLYACITYFTYSRYIQESMIQDTWTGMVTKVRQDAQVAPVGQLKNLANEYVEMALTKFDLVKCKIQNKYGCVEETVKTGFSEIIGIRRDHNAKNKGKFYSNYFSN